MICEELTTKIKEELLIEYDINVEEELNDSDQNVEFVDYYNDEMEAGDCLEIPSDGIKQDDTADNTEKKKMQCALKGNRKKKKKQTAKLIDTVKKYPLLYDPSHEEYTKNRRDKIWANIAAVLGEDSVDAVKAKWKNLRDSYSKSLRYNYDSKHKHLSCYRQWPWSHKMSFLQPYLDPANITGTNYKPKWKDIKRKKTMEKFFNDKNKYYDKTDLLFLGYSKTLKKMSKRNQAITKFKIAEIIMKAEEEIALETWSTVSLKNKCELKSEKCVLQPKTECNEEVGFQEPPVPVTVVDSNTVMDPLLLIPDVQIKRSDSVDF